MKTVLFQFENPAGTFWIHPEPAGRVRLRLDGHALKSYASAKAAALAVSRRSTGWEPWDTAEHLIAPRGLENWKRGTATLAQPQRKVRRTVTEAEEDDVSE